MPQFIQYLSCAYIGFELSEEVILSHEVVGVGGDGGDEGGGGEFHL